MPVTVIVRSGTTTEEPELSITLDAPMIVIGRGDGCDVRLPDPSVSHRHATIRQRGNEHIAQDEGSVNGTVIGGVRLASHAPRIIKNGELVRVGRIWLEIRLGEAGVVTQSALATKELALRLVARALDAQGEEGGPVVIGQEGPDQGKTLRLVEMGRVYVMGRSRDVDLVLDESDASRRHVQLVRRGDQLLARDLASKNGGELAGTPLSTDRDMTWRRGEVLRIGKSTFVFQHAAAEALHELEHAADEKIRAEESLRPPASPTSASATGSYRPPPPADDAAGGLAAANASGGGGAGAPIAMHPRGPAASGGTRPTSSGFGRADLVVVFLALGVLALSVLGLVWLFRG